MKEVTVEWLKSQEACSDQVALFEATFGQSAKITKCNLLKATSAGLSTDWLARRCLKGKARRAYEEAIASAWRAYEEAIASAWRAYEEATAPASRAYNEARTTASRAYEEAIAPARRAYEEAIAPARRAYNEATAIALWDALKLQHKG